GIGKIFLILRFHFFFQIQNYNNQQRQQQDRPLPKFGEWDVNDPASAEGFTVIFAKARDDKKTNASGRAPSQRRDNNKGQDEPTVTFLLTKLSKFKTKFTQIKTLAFIRYFSKIRGLK
ncbi:unnamed protein product, partial [Brassica oleracea]